MGWPAGQMWLFGVCPSPVCQRTRPRVSCGPDWRTEARREGSTSFTRRVLCLALDPLLFPEGRAGPQGNRKRRVLLAHVSWTAARTPGLWSAVEAGLPSQALGVAGRAWRS